jgi:hypothetical protein
VYLIVSPGSALRSPSTSPPTGKVAFMVAVKVPTGGGSGCGAGAVGGMTNGAASEDRLVFASLFVEEGEPSRTAGTLTLRGAAMAAKGVIRIVNDRRQATNTRRLPAAGSGDNSFTT